MTTMVDFCGHLLECVEKLEEQIKIEINDCENKVTSGEMEEMKVVLEKAKDYHYKEIINILKDILDKVKIIKFHQDKVFMLSDEKKVPQQELKRYSYVQRQVKNFSKSESNLNTLDLSAKRERRRVASEISSESLETWEKFLDSNKGEAPIIQKNDTKINTETIPKRRSSGIRKKKKVISSTINGFLDSGFRCSSLDSIVEVPDSETCVLEKGYSTPNLSNYEHFIENRPWLIKDSDQSEYINGTNTNEDVHDNEVVSKGLITITECDTKDAISVIENENTDLNKKYENLDSTPKIVDIILKQKPS